MDKEQEQIGKEPSCNNNNHPRDSLMPGIILVIVGIAFLLPQLKIIPYDKTWPLLILAPGIGFWVLYLSSKDRQKSTGLLIPGTITIILAIFFFYNILTNWQQMVFLWPVFPLSVAIAFYIYYFASHRKEKSILIPANILALISLFFIFLSRFTFRLWPTLLIIAGAYMLFASRKHRD